MEAAVNTKGETAPGAVLGLGSNRGDRRGELGRALLTLEERYGLRGLSSVYATPPEGAAVTGEFLNLCAALGEAPPPRRLLGELHEMESRAGRPAPGRDRSGDRRLDLDLLLYGGRRIRRSDLLVPHPGLGKRAFVLAPLREIGGDWLVPGTGRTVESLAADVEMDGLRRLGPARELMRRARRTRRAGGVRE